MADGLNETVANFTIAHNNLIAGLVHPTDLVDQQLYLETSKKPYRLNCAALAACIETINKLMSLFPGVAENPPMQPVDIKNLFYQMMPAEWQCAFLNSGQVITNCVSVVFVPSSSSVVISDSESWSDLSEDVVDLS